MVREIFFAARGRARPLFFAIALVVLTAGTMALDLCLEAGEPLGRRMVPLERALTLVVVAAVASVATLIFAFLETSSLCEAAGFRDGVSSLEHDEKDSGGISAAGS